MPVKRFPISAASRKAAAPPNSSKPKRRLYRQHDLSLNPAKLAEALTAHQDEVLAQNEQLREARLELERSKNLYAGLYEQAPVGLLTLDRNGVIEKANLTAFRLMGASRETMIHRPLLVYVHEEDRRALLNFLLTAPGTLGQTKPWVELRLRNPSGGYSHVQLSAVYVGRDSGKGMVYLTAITDLTGRAQLDQERRVAEQRIADAVQQRAAAQAANDAKDRFLAMLSHELRTPLTPALLCISAMAQDPALPDDVRHDLRVVLTNIHLEVRLIDDLLDFNKILHGKLRTDFERLDLRDVIREALDICRPDLQTRRLVLLPDFYCLPIPVNGDRVRLLQVFWNVLRNAVKFTPDGAQISIGFTRSQGMVRIRFTDTGVGIEPDVLPRIFDLFEQGGTGITRRFGGLGLGLTISRSIIEAHNGTIEARSEGKDRGATVIISLPLVAESHNGKPADSHLRTRAAHAAQRPLRILLVEDHAETRSAITILLRQRDYQLHSVPSARQAAHAASKKPFDLVISDLGLRDRSGYDLMRQLRARHNLKGIALSGFGSENDQKLSKDAGFEMHIVKPVTLEALEQAINSIFAS